MKTHMKSTLTEKYMPGYLKEKYHLDGFYGAMCGYMMRNVTTEAENVDCLTCQKNMKTMREGLK